jgi:hypothetical protein
MAWEGAMQVENIRVESLTDESGTAYAVVFDVGCETVYSKWSRLNSAEKLARTLRNAYGIHGDDDADGVHGGGNG